MRWTQSFLSKLQQSDDLSIEEPSIGFLWSSKFDIALVQLYNAGLLFSCRRFSGTSSGTAQAQTQAQAQMRLHHSNWWVKQSPKFFLWIIIFFCINQNKKQKRIFIYKEKNNPFMIKYYACTFIIMHEWIWYWCCLLTKSRRLNIKYNNIKEIKKKVIHFDFFSYDVYRRK